MNKVFNKIKYNLGFTLILSNLFAVMIYLFSFLVISCNGDDSGSALKKQNKPIPAINYIYAKSFPHDTISFTEGFLFHNGELYESTGATHDLPYTRSLFGVVDLNTGNIMPKAELDKNKYFGEGISFITGKVFQLTYRNKVGFIYDASTFKKIKEFKLPVDEGWGMTNNGKLLIISDGSSELTFFDPDSLKVIRKINVTENQALTENLNELEYINGFIYANIWTTNTIVKIDPGNGKIVGKIDLSALAEEAKSIYPKSMEMNGIAYDSIQDKILITGKLWPKIYEIGFNH